MLCVKCGNFLTDDAQVCSLCGSPVGNVTEDEEILISDEDAVSEKPVTEAFDIADDSAAKKRRLPLYIIAGVVFVAALILMILNFGVVRGWVIRSFCSPKNVMVIALQDSAHGTLNNASSLLGAEKQDGYSGALHIKPGQTVVTLLSQFMGGGDTSWLSDIAVSCRSSHNGAVSKNAFTLSLADTDVMAASHLIDLDKNRHWLLLPEVSQTALTGELEPGMQVLAREQLLQSLPSKEVIQSFCDRYIALLVQGFTRVELNRQAFTTGSISQNLFVLEARINETDLTYVMIDLLETLMVDADFKTMLQQFQPLLDALMAEELKNQPVVGHGSLYERFLERAESLLEELRSEFYGADPENEVRLYVYLNSSNLIVGSRLELTGMEKPVYDSYFVMNGTSYASCLDASGFQAVGSGFYENGLNGTIVLSVTQQELVVLNYSNVQLQKRGFTGQAAAQLDPSFMELITKDMTAEAGQMLSMAELMLKMDWNCTSRKSDIHADLLLNQRSMLSLAFSGETADAEPIHIPDASADLDDEQAMTNWVSQADFDAVRHNLITAGVPEQLFTMIELLQAFSA